MAYVTKIRVKGHHLMLPFGYELQVVHNQRVMSSTDLRGAAIEEYKRLNGGKTPTRPMDPNYVEIISKP